MVTIIDAFTNRDGRLEVRVRYFVKRMVEETAIIPNQDEAIASITGTTDELIALKAELKAMSPEEYQERQLADIAARCNEEGDFEIRQRQSPAVTGLAGREL